MPAGQGSINLDKVIKHFESVNAKQEEDRKRLMERYLEYERRND